MLMVYGAQTPSRSRAEMEALASVASIRTVVLPLGKLSVHEEFPDLVVEAIKPFSLSDWRMLNEDDAGSPTIDCAAAHIKVIAKRLLD